MQNIRRNITIQSYYCRTGQRRLGLFLPKFVSFSQNFASMSQIRHVWELERAPDLKTANFELKCIISGRISCFFLSGLLGLRVKIFAGCVGNEGTKNFSYKAFWRVNSWLKKKLKEEKVKEATLKLDKLGQKIFTGCVEIKALLWHSEAWNSFLTEKKTK